MNKKTVVANGKGGVGKSLIATLLATHYGRPILGNDEWAPQGRYLNKDREIYRKLDRDAQLPNLPAAMPVIFDTGGWSDDRVIQMIRMSSLLIVPLTASRIDMDTTVTFLKKASTLTNNILIVVNKAKKGDKQGVHNYLESISGFQFGEYPIVELAESKLFSRVLNSGQSVAEQTKRGVDQWIYRNHIAQLSTLFATIEAYQQSTQRAA